VKDKAVMANVKRIHIKQIRSQAGRAPKFISTVEALGLGRIGKSKTHNATPAVLGMIAKIATILEIKSA